MKKKINFAFATFQQTFTQPCPSPACQGQALWLNPFCIFSSWLHQERVAFQRLWPLSVDRCPWGIRQFKNSPLCTSQKPSAVYIHSGASAWWVTSILIMGDTVNATCCLNKPEGFWWSEAVGSSWLPPPCHAVARQGCSSKGGWKTAPSDAALIEFSAPREEGLISPSCTKRAAGWAWARDSWGSMSAASARRAGALGPSTHARFLLHDLALSLSSLSSLKLLLFLAFNTSLWKCLALEEVCAIVSYRCLLGYIWAVKEVFCRGRVPASCQSKSGTWPGLRNTACGLWFPSIKPHIWHREWCVLARRWNIARWKAVLCPKFQVCLLGLSKLCGMRFPRNLPSSAATEPRPTKTMSAH